MGDRKTMTPGQAAYEEWKRLGGLQTLLTPAWDELPYAAKEGWEEIAKAAINASV